MVIIQEDKEIKIYFISNVDYLLKVKLGYLFKKKKNWRMRILGAVFF